jgi:hypothetical protein
LIINYAMNNLLATGWVITWHSPNVAKSLKPSKSVDTIRGYSTKWKAGWGELFAEGLLDCRTDGDMGRS